MTYSNCILDTPEKIKGFDKEFKPPWSPDFNLPGRIQTPKGWVNGYFCIHDINTDYKKRVLKLGSTVTGTFITWNDNIDKIHSLKDLDRWTIRPADKHRLGYIYSYTRTIFIGHDSNNLLILRRAHGV